MQIVILILYVKMLASLMAQWERIYLLVQEIGVVSLGQQGPLEKEMATHSNILA